MKSLCLSVVALFVFGLVVSNDSAKIQDVQKQIMSIYEKPRGKPEDLVNLAKSYLQELKTLNSSLAQKDLEAIKLAEDMNKEEGPKHIGIIPYGKFIDVFNWNGHNVSDYHKIIAATRWAWDDVLRGIGVEVSEEIAKFDNDKSGFSFL